MLIYTQNFQRFVELGEENAEFYQKRFIITF